MIRVILSFFLLFVTAQAEFLQPEEAFNVAFEKSEQGVKATVELGRDDIYLYDEQLKVYLQKEGKKQEITKKLMLPEPVEYDGFIVHFKNPEIVIPASLYRGAKSIVVGYQGCSKKGLCYAPMEASYTLETAPAAAAPVSESDSITQTLQEGNIFLVLATFFGFGLLLSLTPCVFPMIPILSSIIVSHSGKGKQMDAKRGFFLSVVYVLAMSAAYTIAGVIAGLFGANLQAALQNPFVIVIFAAIFVALAFSMFGYYKIEIPQSWQNKINKTAESESKQGVKGVAVMGFLSALIVGPCVAPPLAGALVYIGQTGDAFLGGAALFVMSIGMGMPLLLVGAGAGKFMPKPGGWMDRVSKAFGVIMLAVAIWMLDRILPPMITMLLWSALLLGTAYFLGAHKLHKHLKPSKLLGLIFALYGIALLVGAFSGATNPLNPLQKFYGEQTKALEFQKVKTLDEIKAIAATSQKPVMIDFYADWCVSCKELEHITFKDPAVQMSLSNFVLLKADVTKNSAADKEMMKAYGVFGPPALIFYKEGKLMQNKIIGYKDPEAFLRFIGENF